MAWETRSGTGEQAQEAELYSRLPGIKREVEAALYQSNYLAEKTETGNKFHSASKEFLKAIEELLEARQKD